MKINEKTFMAMPAELQALFQKLPNPGSEEVTELFPYTKSGKMGHWNNRTTNGSPNGIYGKFNKGHPLSETYGDSGSASRFFYCAKANKKDRNEGCEWMEKRKAGAMSGIETREGKPTNHPMRTNFHPTVKPTDLMRYLCRLVTPKGGTVLDPFMGSGSTGKAAKLEGFDFIGIELNSEYCKIAESRINAA